MPESDNGFRDGARSLTTNRGGSLDRVLQRPPCTKSEHSGTASLVAVHRRSYGAARRSSSCLSRASERARTRTGSCRRPDAAAGRRQSSLAVRRHLGSVAETAPFSRIKKPEPLLLTGLGVPTRTSAASTCATAATRHTSVGWSFLRRTQADGHDSYVPRTARQIAYSRQQTTHLPASWSHQRSDSRISARVGQALAARRAFLTSSAETADSSRIGYPHSSSVIRIAPPTRPRSTRRSGRSRPPDTPRRRAR